MNRTTVFALAALFVVLGVLTFREISRKPVSKTDPDGCVVCHAPRSEISPSHPVKVMGCSVCHLGNPFARDKERAHLGIALNPGSLTVAALTCGRKECHPALPARVAGSVMATNSGILKVMQELWPHEPGESVSNVRELMARPPGASLALDHFRKMCGACHLHKPRTSAGDERARRGGGCTDCHILELKQANKDLSQREFVHPGLTTRIPFDNCLKCHNRSARVALSYTGMFETEAYGTPYARGEPSGRRLSGGRFFMELPGDVHHQKAGLDCIDCHTERGIMGDGKPHVHMEDQVDITCETCHCPPGAGKIPDEELAQRLTRANGRQPPVPPGRAAISPKGSPMYHLRVLDMKDAALFRKRDGKKIAFKTGLSPAAHNSKPHERLKCQACHSAWTPQCYGCHEMLFKSQGQRDWLTGKGQRGRWVEGRSYIRFARPTLGVGPKGHVEPFAPGCQVFGHVFDENNNHQPEHSFRSLVMASFDPHTTVKRVPGCLECHLDPKLLGLGEGSLKLTRRGLDFRPVYRSLASGLGIDFPLDGFVSPSGAPLQLASRDRARPFNKDELGRITRVGPCLACHDTYTDRIYLRFEESLALFRGHKTVCSRELR